MTEQGLKEFIPLEKSWIIRMGVLDLIHGRDQIRLFLNSQQNLGDDLLGLKRAADDWGSDKTLDVGESGTLLRFLRFVSWQLDIKKEFKLNGTLKARSVTNDPNIVKLSQQELLKLDGGTSQWASAKALIGDKDRIPNPPHLLQITYEAIDHYNHQIIKDKDWIPKVDRTIHRQAKAFIKLLKTGETDFKPLQAEDYCFARALSLITKDEGLKRWPQLQNHESNRIKEMETELNNFEKNKEVKSKDHRVVQAIAMLAKYKNRDIKFNFPSSVSKTWPLFWDFLEKASK